MKWMYNLRLLLYNLFMLFCLSVNGQKIEALEVGDPLPEIEIKNLFNYPKSALKLSSLRGKVVIIDFYGKNCSSCIEALPKIDSLQKQFKEKIQVLTVTDFETEADATETLQSFKKSKDVKLPVVLKNNLLEKYFPHQLVSHVVWIDARGVVRAITGKEYVNADNIEKIIAGGIINWPVKRDVIEFDYERPFLDFSKENAGTVAGNMLYYSALTGHMKGVDGTARTIIDTNRNIVTENYFNCGLLQMAALFVEDIPGTYYINAKRTLFNVKDEGRYVQKSAYFAEWENANTFCYAIALPAHYNAKARSKIMKADLRRWFGIMGIEISTEKHPVKVLKLINLDTGPGFFTTNKLPDLDQEKFGYDLLRGANARTLVEHINYGKNDLPWIVDATGLPPDHKANLIINTMALQDPKSLRKELQQYGLGLVEVEEILEMYVIREIDL